MVWPITGAESYVRETGKSMKAVELAATQEDCWRNNAITLTTRWRGLQFRGARLEKFDSFTVSASLAMTSRMLGGAIYVFVFYLR